MQTELPFHSIAAVTILQTQKSTYLDGNLGMQAEVTRRKVGKTKNKPAIHCFAADCVTVGMMEKKEGGGRGEGER